MLLLKSTEPCIMPIYKTQHLLFKIKLGSPRSEEKNLSWYEATAEIRNNSKDNEKLMILQTLALHRKLFSFFTNFLINQFISWKLETLNTAKKQEKKFSLPIAYALLCFTVYTYNIGQLLVMLSALHNWFKLVYKQFWAAIINKFRTG